MKAGFYPRLAYSSIKKNKRLYLPYILTCIGMVMMYYIVAFLRTSENVDGMAGSGTLITLLTMGGQIIAVFACIFLFYTNSFLIRRRKKEFGLYNILGMGKRNIGIILLWESLIVAVLALVIGLAAGIVFSKLAELGLVNLMHSTVNYALSVSPKAIVMTLCVFLAIFVLLLVNSLCQIRFTSAISLLKSENVGEKPPKGNWFFGVLGVLILGAAYYIAVTIKNPIAAITLFFVAVLLVIIGTYLIMISGSVLFCRILQKNKNYYYKANHFVSVSSMAYRMKRNGAGLASICILATMVLVMISATTSLYFGVEDAIGGRFPREIMLELQIEDLEDFGKDNIDAIRKDIQNVIDERGVETKNVTEYSQATTNVIIKDGVVDTDLDGANEFDMLTYTDIYSLSFVPLADYNRITGSSETLEDGEALIYTYKTDYESDTISLKGGETLKIKKHVGKFLDEEKLGTNIFPTITLVLPEINKSAIGVFDNGRFGMYTKWNYGFDTVGLGNNAQIALSNELRRMIGDSQIEKTYGYYAYSVSSRESEKSDFYGLYGGLFYIGIVLSIVFIFAAVLIIYYKQISEGYEDQSRFEIMQNVGMTKKEIRKSINSQLLTVFFMPLIGAGCHLAFAFPIIRKLLMLFELKNVALFAVTTVISFLIFALFYTLVYRITSNAYYNIVSGAKSEN